VFLAYVFLGFGGFELEDPTNGCESWFKLSQRTFAQLLMQYAISYEARMLRGGQIPSPEYGLFLLGSQYKKSLLANVAQ
jgi:hypothetical protein